MIAMLMVRRITRSTEVAGRSMWSVYDTKVASTDGDCDCMGRKSLCLTYVDNFDGMPTFDMDNFNGKPALTCIDNLMGIAVFDIDNLNGKPALTHVGNLDGKPVFDMDDFNRKPVLIH